jgi:4-hydroxymandelate oxidase
MIRAALTSIPSHVVSLGDYEHLAKEHMSAAVAAWLNGGGADERTLQENVSAFQEIRLQNRVLVDLKNGHTRSEILGQQFEYPILLAPVAHHRLLHPEGELATAVAAAAMRAGMVVSTQASISMEDIANKATTAPLWFQLYFQAERAHTEQLVQRAEAAGYKALVLTVDAPVNGIRNQEQRAGFVFPSAIEAVNLRGIPAKNSQLAMPGESPLFGGALLAQAPTWNDVEWLCRISKLPVLLKGILSAKDAEKAIAAGAAGLIVSNHGGRVLDTLPASINALSAITQTVNKQIPVLLDGGIRRGTDVIKALALGANAVLIGRPYMHGLAVAGAVGVAHVLHILRTELEVAMALTGCATLADISPDILFQR